jgi:hypothetical protein
MKSQIKNPSNVVLGAVKTVTGRDMPHDSKGELGYVLTGGGKSDYAFPSTEATLKRIKGKLKTLKVPKKPNDKDVLEAAKRMTRLGLIGPMEMPRPVPLAEAHIRAVSPAGESDFRKGVRGLLLRWSASVFDADIEARFNDAQVIVSHGSGEVKPQPLPPEMVPVSASLNRQLTVLRQRYSEALPKAIQMVKEHFPQAKDDEVQATAFHLLDEEMGPIMATLGIFIPGIKQWMDNVHLPLLRLLRYQAEQMMYLYLTGNMNLEKGDLKSNLLSTVSVSAGDVWIPYLGEEGPATIPVSGPPGAHVLLYPFGMKNDVAFLILIQAHEMMHVVDAIVKGWKAQSRKRLVSKIRAGIGKLGLSVSTVEIAPGVEIPVEQFAEKVLLDQISEEIADLPGGFLVSGPAFFDLFGLFIGALNAMRKGITGTPKLFRPDSIYTFEPQPDGKTLSIDFEVHVPDDARMGIGARAARRLGFIDAANELDALCAAEGNAKLVTWKHSKEQEEKEGIKSTHIIKFPRADYMKIADFFIDVLMFEKYAALGGQSWSDRVCFTQEMADKAASLVPNLKNSNGTLPDDGRHYWLHLIGVAMVQAYKELIKEGRDPSSSIERVVIAGTQMMNQGCERWDSMKAKVDLTFGGAKQSDGTGDDDEGDELRPAAATDKS